MLAELVKIYTQAHAAPARHVLPEGARVAGEPSGQPSQTEAPSMRAQEGVQGPTPAAASALSAAHAHATTGHACDQVCDNVCHNVSPSQASARAAGGLTNSAIGGLTNSAIRGHQAGERRAAGM